jgi:hypothetical protein
MSPQELTVMLDQWARAHAPDYGVTVVNVEVAVLGLADNNMVNESGERGGFFPFSTATLTVQRTMGLIEVQTAVRAGASISSISRAYFAVEEFERLFLKLCHDIWMARGLAVRGRVLKVNP